MLTPITRSGYLRLPHQIDALSAILKKCLRVWPGGLAVKSLVIIVEVKSDFLDGQSLGIRITRHLLLTEDLSEFSDG
ncbi:MAG: hypothetical protein ACFFB5_15765 [Promethearchaeota archaeon]